MYRKIFLLFFLTTWNLVGQSHATDSETSASLSKIEPDTRIVGGTDAKLGDVLCQVSLRFIGGKREYHFCGGCIIFSEWILTAAHCTISKKEEDIKVVAGSTKLKEGGVVAYVEKIFNHPDYINSTLQNDIALLKLKKFIRYDQRTIDKITLATEELPTGSKCNVSGWGYTDTRRSIRTDNLQILEVTTISNEKCKKVFKNYIKPTNVCTYVSYGIGVCQGDSGGPLICGGEVKAIVSFNSPCARGVPDAYTRVYPYRKWIKKTVLDN